MNDVPQKYVSMVYNFDEQMVKNQNYCIYLSTVCYKYHISISKFHFEALELEIIGTSLIKKTTAIFVVGRQCNDFGSSS